MRQHVLELRSQRVKLVHDARQITDKAIAEKRELSPEEQAQWDKIMADVDALKGRIDQVEAQLSADDMAGEDQEMIEAAAGVPEDEYALPARGASKFAAKNGGRLPRTVPGGVARNTGCPHRARRATPEYRDAFINYILGRGTLEARAIQADNDLVGGYLVAPQQFVSELIKFLDDNVFIRSKARKFTVSASQSLGAPSLDTDVSDSDWTSELATGNEDSSMAFGKRELHPHPLAKRIKVSNKLIRISAIPAESLVQERLRYKFGITEEKAFLTGSGSNRPLGLYTASSLGISTSRDVVTGTTTDFTADGLIDVMFNVKGAYQDSGEWLVHRDGLKRIRKLKDGVGQYLWGPGLEGNSPDQLLGRPVNVSEYNPNTFTTGQYVILFGDLSYYWIADAESLAIQKLSELYAESNQTGFIARMELDAMPVLEEAFSRGKLA